MARMALRSPYFITRTAPTGALSVKLTISIENIVRYTLVKSATAGETYDVGIHMSI